MPTFGERLSELRKEKGLSQKEFARIFKLGQSTIAMYETNKREPDTATLNQFAEYLHVTTDYLLGRSNIRGYENDDPTPEELEKVIKEANIMFDGTPLTDQDKEDVIDFIKIALRAIKKRKIERGEL